MSEFASLSESIIHAIIASKCFYSGATGAVSPGPHGPRVYAESLLANSIAEADLAARRAAQDPQLRDAPAKARWTDTRRAVHEGAERWALRQFQTLGYNHPEVRADIFGTILALSISPANEQMARNAAFRAGSMGDWSPWAEPEQPPDPARQREIDRDRERQRKRNMFPGMAL